MDIQEIQVEYANYLQLYALLDTNQMETVIAFPRQFTVQLDMRATEMGFAY